MRPKMNAKNTIASVSAKPSHWIEGISSRISGWRVTDSMTLPERSPSPMPRPAGARPAPMPGPMVPRPAPMPRARPLVLPLWAMTSIAVAVRLPVLLLVSALGDGAAEVDGSESGEDECLQAGDQHDLEYEEDDGDRKGDHADRREPEQRDHAAAHEQDQ